MPAASCPRIAGAGHIYRPSTKCRSLWQTPLATTLTRTSRSCGSSISTFSIFSGWLGPLKIAAFILMLLDALPPELIEIDNRARDLARLHRAKRLVHVFEL